MLKLWAQDTEDLGIISAHMQDALVRPADMRYLSRARKFAFLASRFVWENPERKERRRTGLHFENVLSVRQVGIPHPASQIILSLLSMTFEPGLEPSGAIILTFSAGFSMRLNVEYIDLRLRDLDISWTTEKSPRHDI